MNESPNPSQRPSDLRCPICATGLTTGQGLYSCPSCEWTGTVEESARGNLVLAGREPVAADEADEPTSESADDHDPTVPNP